jgi:hypothetical protein
MADRRSWRVVIGQHLADGRSNFMAAVGRFRSSLGAERVQRGGTGASGRRASNDGPISGGNVPDLAWV